MSRVGLAFGFCLVLSGSVAQSATTHVIQVGSNFFNPSAPTISRGDTVKWVWVSGIHTTTSGIRNTAGAGSLWDQSIDAGHTSFSRVFNSEGSFPFFCRIHASMSGTITVTTPTAVFDDPPASSLPSDAGLDQNVPNPFNAGTAIPYELRASGHATLIIANILGQTVRKLVDANQAPGWYSASWDGRDGAGRPVSSGLYFYRLETGNVAATRKMVLLR